MTIIDVCRLCRFSLVGFSLLVPLVGAASVSPSLSGARLGTLAAAAAALHIFGYVTNDLFDLAIDRTQPLRAGSPLVRGVVSPRAALAIALVALLVAALVNVLAGVRLVGNAVLAAGIAFGMAYNAWGKRMPVPLAGDALQGLAWVALVMFGALATGEPLNAVTGWLAATIFIYVLLINGLHGGLRDMANDALHGARTTALLLGAHADGDGRLVVPRALAVYGFALQLLLLLLAVACMIDRPALVAAIVAGHAMLFRIGWTTLRAASKPPELIRGGMLHLFLSIGVVCLPFAFRTNAFAASVIVALYAIPLLILTVRLTTHAMRARVAAMLVLAILPVERAAAQETVQVVPREEILGAMKVEDEKPYDLETANAARFNAGVILQLARHRRTSPFVLTHEDYFQAFLALTAGRGQVPPIFISEAHKASEDQYVDARPTKVIASIRGGDAFGVNVVAGWTGPPKSYTYEDRKGKPALRTTHQRVTSYRLLDLGGDLVLIDEMQGISGRVLDGLLAKIFSVFGDADAVRSYLVYAPDGTQVVRATGKIGFFGKSVFATVTPRGVGTPDVPDRYEVLKNRIEHAVDDISVTYVPMRAAEALGWRRVTAP